MDVHAKSKDGLDVACYCARGGHVEVMQFLVEEVGMDVRAKYIKHGVDVNSEEKMEVLHVAAHHDHLELVKWLVLEQGVDVTVKVRSGHYALVQAAGRGGLRTFQWLVSMQPSVKAMSKALDTGFRKACQYGQLDIVEWLVSAPMVDPPITDDDGETLVDVASSGGHAAIVECPRKAEEEWKEEDEVSRGMRGKAGGFSVDMGRALPPSPVALLTCPSTLVVGCGLSYPGSETN